MARAAFYVDGFNLYHSLKGHPKTAKALWLDLRAMGTALLTKQDQLSHVVYFTALTHWNKGKMQRHGMFLSALESSGVEVVQGRFGPTQKQCGECGKVYDTFEEKETDVNISTRLVKDALTDKFDFALLLTGDADQVPTIRLIRELAPTKQIVAVFPPRRPCVELELNAHRHIQLSWKHIARNQFPPSIVLPTGKTIDCPPSWLP